jgi:undecaprenyl-diphosphatase
MDLIEAILVAVIQGATELFPVSSLGHAVVLPALLNLSLDEKSPEFLPFLVLLHAGTAAALLLFFWRDWWLLLIGGLGLTASHQRRESRRVILLIVVATIPAVVVGFLLEKFLRGLFGSPVVAAAFLIVNGVILAVGERIRTMGHRPLATLTIMDAFLIGCSQCAALIPGISRSGATIVAGLLRGVDHEGAAHFSFLIATPIIIGATALEVPKLLRAEVPPGVFSTAAIAAGFAAVTALLTTWFLMRYFRGNDDMALNPFAGYCVLGGLGALAWLLLR